MTTELGPSSPISSNLVPNPTDVLSQLSSRYFGMDQKTLPSGISTLGLYREPQIPGPEPNYKIYLVTTGTSFRPDLISYEAYGSTTFWWYILQFNHINGVEEIVPNLTLKIPNLRQMLIRQPISSYPIFA